MNSEQLHAMVKLLANGWEAFGVVLDGDTILVAARRDGQFSILVWSPYTKLDETTGEYVPQPITWDVLSHTGPTRGAALLRLLEQAGHNGLMEF